MRQLNIGILEQIYSLFCKLDRFNAKEKMQWNNEWV